jgi:transposase
VVALCRWPSHERHNDNASWHIPREVREWLASHNQEVKKSSEGVEIISCLLPKTSPWLNPIEPKWVYGKRRVVEPNKLLGADDFAKRIRATFDCPHYEHLFIPENVA